MTIADEEEGTAAMTMAATKIAVMTIAPAAPVVDVTARAMVDVAATANVAAMAMAVGTMSAVATSSAAAVAVAANMVMVMLAVNEALAALTIWACDELIYVQCGTDELADFLRSLTIGRIDRES